MNRWLVCCAMLAACGHQSPTGTAPPCVAPDYLNCPTLAPSTMLLVNQTAVVVTLEAARQDATEIALSDSPAPGQTVCQWFGRWIPDSTILLLGLTGTTSTRVGSFNARSQPGWVVIAKADGSWTLTPATGPCLNPETLTF